MGCFNRTGFLSHLPITYQDEIVIFLLADTSRIERIYSIPCYTIGSGFTPISLPFFGQYDDYGSIDSVFDDFNSRYFKKKIGMPIDEVCNILLERENANASYLSIVKSLKELNKPECETYCKEDKIKTYETLKSLYQKILGIDEKMVQELDSTDEITRWESNEILNCTITFTMELKAIYDKMIEINNRTYDSDQYLYGLGDTITYSLEDTFDHTSELVQCIAKRGKHKKMNPLTFDSFRYLSLDTDELEEMMKEKQFDKVKELLQENTKFQQYKPYYWFSYYTRFSGGCSGFLDYRLYENFDGELSEMKQDAINFVHFLEMMKTTSTVFTLSPSHHQDVDYSRLTDLYKEMANLMQAKKEAQESDEEEDEEDEID